MRYMSEIETSSSKDKIQEKTASILKDEDNILFAYLYGSIATDRFTEDSDIDIGIYCSEKVYDNLYPERLSSKLEKGFDRDFDVRILNDRNLIFLHQVLKNGELLFSKDDRKRVEFETEVYDRYLDMKYYFDQYNDIRRKRVTS